MKLPLTSWNKTLKTLGYKVVRQANQKRKRELEMGQQNYERLEPRQMLAGDTGLTVQADLTQLLSTQEDPLVAKLGQFDANPSFDLAILNSSGTLTVATNGDNDAWQTNQTVDLGVGPLHAMELSLVNDDAFADLILQGPDNLFVALNDGNGNFSVTQTLTPFAAGEMAPGVGDQLGLEVSDLNGDFVLDVVALAPGIDQLAVYFGVGDGTFSAAVIESTGASTPTSVVAGDFIGNGFPDLAVGHADGTVTFLQNEDGNAFSNRSDLSVAGFSPISDLDTADLDADGDADIVVTSGDAITILDNQRAQLQTAPTIDNGTFGQGLTGWNTEIVGHQSDAQAGTVIAQSGFAQLVENESFLVSANQDFVVPANPETIEVDLLSIGLEDPAGGIPDAFEISILGADGKSLVPTFRPDATSLFNVNPGNEVSLAPGVTFDGTTVSVDISSLPEGTEATLYLDLIGNGPGNGSTVTFDNVRITPEEQFDSVLTQTTLEGPFVDADQTVVDDVDGDGRLDIAAIETSGNMLFVFNGQADGSFDREDIDLSSLGDGFVSLDASPLTAGDGVSDLVVLADGTNVAISPLVGDDTPPTAALTSPIANQTNTGNIERIDIQFSEPMRNLGAGDPMSVTNSNNYTVTFLGTDGVEGTSDDEALNIVGVSYEPLTGMVSLDIDPASTPLEDGVYVVTLDSLNLKDRSDNELSDGSPVSFEFTMNSEGPAIASVDPLTGTEGSIVDLFAGFTDAGGAVPYEASIDWGDGSTTALNMVDFEAGEGMLAANHIYADNGTYNITLTVQDAGGISTQAFTTATIENVAPEVTAGADATVVRNQSIELLVGNFTDAGFDNINTGTSESFAAIIDWGDGSPSESGTVEFVTGMPGTPSTGSVSGSHTFGAAGTFTVTVTVSDDDGGTQSQQLSITVLDDVPEVADPASVAAAEGSEVTVATTFDDLGADGTYNATVDWGDGSSESANVTFANGSGTIDASHTYADDGSYTVTFSLVDPDNNAASVSTTADVSNVAPTLVVASDQTLDIGQTLSLTAGNFSDPGFDNAGANTAESFLVSVDWGDGTSDSPTAAVTQGSEGVDTTGVIDASHVYGSPGTYTVTVTVSDDDNGVSTDTFEVVVNEVVTAVGAWLPTINFDADANANGLDAGAVVTDQYAAWGVNITTHDPVNHPAMIFDSANPTGGDNDLATTDQSNILIISEDADISDPDDRAAGGTLIFNFDNAVMLDDVGLLDIDTSETATIRLYDDSSNLISETVVSGAGDSTAQTVALSATLVSRMEIELSASGAVTFLEFCRDGHSPVSATAGSAANEGDSWSLSLDPGSADVTQWVVNWGDGNVETVSGTDASHVYADGNQQYEVTATAFASDGSVYNADAIAEVLNVDPVLTISGAPEVESGADYTLDLSSTDPGADTIFQWIVDWGDGTDPEVIQGNPTEVTHQYETAGDYSVVAQAFDEDSLPTASGSEVEIVARGSEGGENFNLIVDGVTVANYTVTTAFQSFVYQSDEFVNIGDVRIEFTNDHWDPANGIDFNLVVDYVDVDGVVYQTEADEVYSTGTWKSGDGITPGFRNSEWLHANGYFQFAGNTTQSDLIPYVSNSVSVSVSQPTSVWLPTINFDRDADGLALNRGEVVTDQFSSIGVHVTTNDPVNHPAMIFDSANPTGGDSDLGTSNQGNVLIISEDADSSDPDDNASGGTLIFTFDQPVMLDEVGLLDIDQQDATIILYDANGNQIQSTDVAGQGNNSQQTVALDALGVSRMEIVFTGSGAVTDIVFCREGHSIDVAPAKFYVAEGSTDDVYRYTAGGEQIDGFAIKSTATSRGVTTTTDGSTAWVVKSNEWVYVYGSDGSYEGEWDAVGPDWARGIATDDTNFWIVDDRLDRVYYYADAADWRSGSYQATSTFNLNNFNDDPSGIEVHGDTLWVTDLGRDQVFVYSTSGSYLGKWNLDSNNRRPSGITTDSSGQNLWVTDYDDGQIYYYAGAADRTSGSLSATSVIDLPGNNPHPEGIADPTIPINLDEVVSGTITAAGEQVEYSFDAVAGTNVFFDVLSGSISHGWSLVSPSGATIFSNLNYSDVGSTEIPETGTYTLTVGRTNVNRIGNFSFSAVTVPQNSPVSINLDEVASGTISTAGEQVSYSFDVTAGTNVFFDVLSGTLFHGWSLESPSGATVFSSGNFSDVGSTELLETGSYTLTVGRASVSRTGNFSFSAITVPENSPVPINFDEVVSGTITTAGEQVSYTLDVTAGEELFFAPVAGSLFTGWSLVSPNGATVFNSGNFQNSGTLQLNETGTYTLTVGRTNANVAGDFSFQVWDVVVEQQNLALNTVYTDFLPTPGSRDVYSLDITQPTDVYLDIFSFGGGALRTTMIAPDGSTVWSNNSSTTITADEGPFLLDQIGVYELIFERAEEYSFELVAVPETTSEPIDYDQIVNGDVDIRGQRSEYTFSGVAGDPLTLDLLYSASNIVFELIGPDGTSLVSRGDETTTIPALPQTGQYTIAFAGTRIGGGTTPVGEYNFRILQSDEAPTPVTQAPDLVVSDIASPAITIADSPNAPVEFTLSWTVTNTGNAATTSNAWVDRIYLLDESRDPEFQNDFILGDIAHVGSLNPGESYTASATFELPTGFTADFTVYVETDARNDSFENTAESNNSAFDDGFSAIYEDVRDGQEQSLINLDIETESIFPAGQTIPLTGQATTFAGTQNVIFVIDVSASTGGGSGIDANFDGVFDDRDDINGDGAVGDILDAELGAALSTIERISGLANTEVALQIFADGGTTLDLSPEFLNQSFVDPQSDLNENGVSDFEESLRSISAGRASLFRPALGGAGTNFAGAVLELQNLLPIAQEVDQTTVYFLTDGAGAVSDNLTQPIADAGIDFRLLQIGGNSLSTGSVNFVDAVDQGISNATATLVADPDDLTATILNEQTITDVRINGQSVELLDAEGNFSLPVALQPGINEFLVESFVGDRQVASEVINLIGSSVFDVNTADPVGQIQESFLTTTFNRCENQLHVSFAATNEGTFPYASDIGATFEIDAPSVSLTSDSVDGVTDQGEGFLILDTEIADGILSPDETSDFVSIIIDNPLRQRFGIDVDFRVAQNDAPEFVTIPEIIAAAGEDYEYASLAEDPNSHEINYSLLSAPNGMTIDPATGLVSWIPGVNDIGNHSVTIMANDQFGGTTTQTFVLATTPAVPDNLAPVIISEPIVTLGITQDQLDRPDFTPIIIAPGNVGSTDATRFTTLPTDDPALFGFTGDVRRVNFDTLPNGTPIPSGTFLTDQYASEGVLMNNIEVRSDVFRGAASAPNATTVPEVVGERLTFTFLEPVVAVGVINTSPDMDLFEFYSPEGDLIFSTQDPTGNAFVDLFVGAVSNTDQLIGSMVLGNNTGSLELDELIFEVPPANRGDYLYDVNAIDPENDNLTYSLVDGPDGMTIDPATGQISWFATADNAQIGDAVPVTVTVDDGQGGQDTQSFVINIVDDSPGSIEGTVFDDLNSDGIQQAGENGIASRTVFIDANNNGQVDINEDVAVTQSDGTFTFTGLFAGTYSVGQILQTGWAQTQPANNQSQTVEVTAGTLTGSVDFGVVANGLTDNTAPSITSQPRLDAAAGNAYSYQVAARDPDGDAITFSLLNAPEGMEIDPATGFVTWIPTYGQLGLQDVLIQASDSFGNVDTQGFGIFVARGITNLPPQIVSDPARYVETDNAFAYLVEADDLDGDSLTFSLLDFPDGMTINSVSGQVSWTPTATDIGVSEVSVLVEDGNGGIDVQIFDLEVGTDAPASISGSKITTVASTERVFVGHDVNTLASQYGNAQDQQFAVNLAQWLTDDTTGSLLLMQSATDQFRNYDPNVIAALENAGFTVTTTLEVNQTLTDLQTYDAVFTGISFPGNQVTDSQVLIDYVEGGGGVYVFGGTLDLPNVLIESTAWDPFLNHFGLDYDPSAYNLISPSVAVDSDHPVFDGITTLGSGNGSNIIDLEPSNPGNQILVSADGQNVYAVYDGRFNNSGIATESWSVYLDLNENGVRDASEPATLTDASGTYTFENLRPGTYVVAEEIASGWTAVSPSSGQQAITVTAGEFRTDVDFINAIESDALNLPPRFISSPETVSNVNEIYLYSAEVFDAEVDTVTFALIDGPDNASVNAQTGVITWVPRLTDLGSQPFTIEATDSANNTQQQIFVVDVQPGQNGPVFTSQPLRIATTDAPYEYTAIAEDADGDRVRYQLLSGPAGMTVDRETGVVTWTPSAADLGMEFVVQLEAIDTSGRRGFQAYSVQARDTNLAPNFISTPIETVSGGATYQYLARATDPEGDSISYSLEQSAPGMTINPFTGVVTFTPSDTDIGQSFDVSIVATDEFGLSTTQDFAVAVEVDSTAPVVEIALSNTLIEPGDSVTIQVSASDDVGVESLELTIDGVAVSLNELNQFTYIATGVGLPMLVATATDASGNVGTAEREIRVVDLNDTEAPFVQINSPVIASQVTYLTDVAITVDGDDIWQWYLEYSLKDNETWTRIAEGDAAVNNQIVGTFDPTLLRNDLYDLRVTAFDINGNSRSEKIFVGVEGQAKLGNYAIEFTDLNVPLAGIPIQITRQYDTLNTNESGDFGFGWKLAIGEADIRETIPVSQSELAGVPPLFSGVPGFFEGTRVYITTPEGQRVGFTFTPEPSATLLGAQFTPKFTADVDTDYELEVPFLPLSQNADGTFGLYLFGGSYNPREYTLVSQDQVRYTYDQFEELQTVTDRNGVELEYRDDGIFSSTGESIEFVRDDQGRITSIIDPLGNALTYTYDANGDLISYADQVNNTWTHEYDVTGNAAPHFLERITGPRGNVINEVQYDEDGRFVSLVDALGNAVELDFDIENNSFFQTDRNGNTTTLEYDDRGNITLERDALGNERIYEYADDRQIHLETAITNARGFTTNFTYDDAGNVTLLEEPGRFTRFEYDSFNNVTKQIGPFETLADEGTARVTEFKYDVNGNLIETIDALGNSSFQTNDQFGRPLTFTDRRGNVTELEYAQLIGSPTRVINPDGTFQEFTYDDLGRPLTQTNELGVVVQTITFDDAGRQLSVSGADGQLTSYIYDADLLQSETVRISASENQVTSYEYDDNNRLFRQTDGIGAVIELTYDPVGNVTSLRDPVGNITEYVFDEIDRQIEETDPLDQITTYAYDEVGNLTEQVDRLGRRIEFVYDELDRQTAELWYSVDDTLIETSSYTYDIFNNLLTASDAESAYAYNYDLLDRLLSSNNAGTPDTPNVILSYTYDVDGNRIRVEDNSGVTIDSEYGNRNQLLSKTWLGGEVDDARIEYSYDDALRETEARRYSDTDGTNQIGRTETAYDDTGRRVRITHLDDGNDIVLANYEYEFDNANRITQQVIDDDVVDYTYDATGQLLTADHSDSSIPDEFYIYDLNGNRIESHLHGSDYVTGPNNQLLSDGEFNYEYDDEGNQIRRTNIETGEVTEFEYDHRNRLVKTTVKTAGGIITSESQFVFDVFGRRIAVINDADGAGPGEAVRTNIVYDGDNAWANYNEAGEAIARYLFGDTIDSNIARWRAGEGTAWYLADHLGTVRAIADATGVLVNQTTYDSFGQVLNETNSLFGDRYKFTGRELNSGSDYFYRARQYNASSGRFGSLDPIGFGGLDANFYRYVFNSPIDSTDPTGNLTFAELALTVEIIGFVLLVADCTPLANLPPLSFVPVSCYGLITLIGRVFGLLDPLEDALQQEPPQ